MDGEEAYALAKKYINDHGGGGGGGTTNYNALSNKPKIAGTELSGDKSLHTLGIQAELAFDSTPAAGSVNPVTSSGIKQALDLKVAKETGKGLSTNDYTAADKNKLTGIEAGAEVNDIITITVNGVTIVPVDRVVALNVLTETVNNLVNYYKKTETYTQAEVNALIGSLTSLDMQIVETLPTSDISTTTIYLVRIGDTTSYTQYIYTGGQWATLGNTTVDLNNYYTKAQIDALLADKQDALSFDSVPTALSENPVTSGGVYNALAGKQNTLTFDPAPTANSNNSVTSGAVKTALDEKQDTLAFDTVPTAESTAPVTSGGVYDALAEKEPLIFFGTMAQWEALTDTQKAKYRTLKIPEVGYVPAFIGTQAEWEALTLAEKIVYAEAHITDDEVGTPEYYSTTETKTNKVWIDGKPIYRKVLQIIDNGAWTSDITALGNNVYRHSDWSTNIDMIVEGYAMSKRSDGYIDILMSHGSTASTGFVPNITQNTFYYNLGGAMPIYAYAILEYTKEG